MRRSGGHGSSPEKRPNAKVSFRLPVIRSLSPKSAVREDHFRARSESRDETITHPALPTCCRFARVLARANKEPK
jgi:hypothetical protein